MKIPKQLDFGVIVYWRIVKSCYMYYMSVSTITTPNNTMASKSCNCQKYPTSKTLISNPNLLCNPPPPGWGWEVIIMP